ncbi:hypothetical protein PF002_g27989 [Phytophthora fragariae]|nr:hypothetical protein PF009_g27253 [Phytophthora fragariae]KAE8970791.1 hypothetical protein PF011_g26286 [Phytophthora fragariae]KAE9071409.1 hypothetical protein PF007_g26571 [Phytophthora fragariae]KAE9086483.1 hypothetical protein PF006_g26017 [Phytophthora fragariae]KAE9175349.1 hypothetical protein PF004_g26416 [Phytophthora fragariae]
MIEREIEREATSRENRVILFENSTGMGKTQMAFNLQASERWDVLYVPCTYPDDGEESVHKAFDERTMAFWNCVEMDEKVLKNGSVVDFLEHEKLHLYAFIVAALRGDETFRGQATRTQVEQELYCQVEGGEMPLVVSLDDIPSPGTSFGSAGQKTTEKTIRVMRNWLHSFGIPTILTSTNGAARSLSSFQQKLSPMRETPWCVVVPSLPAVVNIWDQLGHRPNNKIPDPLEWILQHSRPLFANAAREFLIAKEHYGNTAADWLRVLSELTAYLAPRIRDFKEDRISYEFGQVCLLLGCDLGATDTSVNLVDGHFGCLDESKPFDLEVGFGSCLYKDKLQQVEIDVGGATCLYKDKVKWKCRYRFPSVENDMLLYLTLLVDHKMEDAIFRPWMSRLHWMMESEDFKCADLRSSAVQDATVNTTIENLLVGAVVIASHRDKFCGVTFPAFLGRLLYELFVVGNIDTVVSLPSDHEKNTTMIPFLSPPNIAWPKGFLDGWKDSGAQFATMFTSSTHEDWFQFASSDADERCVVSGECMRYPGSLESDDLKRVMKNVPSSTSIHFVVVGMLHNTFMYFYNAWTPDVAVAATSDTRCVEPAEELDSEKLTISESAAQLLALTKLQNADFYCISKHGDISEFKELMEAKSRVSDVSAGSENGGGKVIIFVEVELRGWNATRK